MKNTQTIENYYEKPLTITISKPTKIHQTADQDLVWALYNSIDKSLERIGPYILLLGAVYLVAHIVTLFYNLINQTY